MRRLLSLKFQSIITALISTPLTVTIIMSISLVKYFYTLFEIYKESTDSSFSLKRTTLYNL